MSGPAARSAPAPGPWDPGLQPERTALAWQRTGLAAAVTSLVGLRQAVVDADLLVAAPAVLGLVAGVAVLRCARSDLRTRLAALRAGLPLPAPVAGPVAALSVLALCVTVLAVLLR